MGLLTEAGKRLKPLGKEVISMASRLDKTMVSIQEDVIGEMTVGCSTTSGKYKLSGFIDSLRKDFPL